MDIDRIRKINALASELLKKGLVSDWQQASSEAEKVFKNRDQDSVNVYRETLKETEKTPASLASETADAGTSGASVSLTDDKIKEIMEQNTAYLVKVLKEFQEKLEALEREVTVLKNRTSTIGAAVREPVSQRGSFSENHASGGENGQAQAPATHPRSGNYKDSDVSIEKFFYMGAKR